MRDPAAPSSPSGAPPPTKGKVKRKAPEEAHAEAVVEGVARTSPMEKRKLAMDQRILMGEVQLLLADKRTAYALMRTGVTIGLVPVSIWTILGATRRVWSAGSSVWLLALVGVVSAALFALGVYLVVHALLHVRHTERVLAGLRHGDTVLEELLMKETGSFPRRLLFTRGTPREEGGSRRRRDRGDRSA